jgi:hypothetical protein
MRRHWGYAPRRANTHECVVNVDLPDVSELAVADLRNRAAGELEGVIAEMLRLTEPLRKRIGERPSIRAVLGT